MILQNFQPVLTWHGRKEGDSQAYSTNRPPGRKTISVGWINPIELINSSLDQNEHNIAIGLPSGVIGMQGVIPAVEEAYGSVWVSRSYRHKPDAEASGLWLFELGTCFFELNNYTHIEQMCVLNL